jgi:hypothetical protein
MTSDDNENVSASRRSIPAEDSKSIQARIAAGDVSERGTA